MEAPDPAAAAVARFPVVGLGASAGGLEALSAFLGAVPERSGIAYIVVTHQHPDHVSQLPEILARRTRISVVVASEGGRIEPDRVYVCPPGERLGLIDGAVRLFTRQASTSDLPIDSFLRSLAADMKTRAVAVILSGTGSDGTAGARAIKAAAGLVLAQDPSTADHDGMPASVIRSGSADAVLPPEDMPAQILAHAAHLARSAETEPRVSSDVLQRILVLVRDRTGRDFSSYKQSTVLRRTERRMQVRKVVDAASYLHFLAEHPDEIDQLFKDLLISVTTFFRDPEVWQRLQDEALPALLRSVPAGSTFRAWVPGCATGEEVYTLAIALREVCEREGLDVPLQLFGTDLDRTAIDVARTGLFAASVADDLGAERLARWFRPDGAGVRIRKDIRERVTFALHDLLQDPPFTRLHLVSCRNLLIYLQPKLQQRLMPVFHYALNPDGVLLLGNAETVGQVSELFDAIDQRSRIFRRRDGAAGARTVALPPVRARRAESSAAPQASAAAPEGAIALAVEHALAARYVPPSLAVDVHGEVAHVQGRTGDYLELAPGRPTHNAFAMARSGLSLALTSAVREALARATRVVYRGVELRGEGGPRRVDVVAEPLDGVQVPAGLALVSFEPARAVRAADGGEIAGDGHGDGDELRIRELEHEVKRTGEHLQRTIGELQSSNEELQSSNEELQSSNEELETSKEEMQSLNEELQTVNSELQIKVESLSQVNDDMANLLNSTAIATVFLDRGLRIKRYTQPVTALIPMIESDIGRPIGDLASTLSEAHVQADAEAVLRTLVVKESQLRARDGRHYLMRILPYRTTDNVIDGVVITFVDTTELHTARVLAESRRLALSIVETVREPLIVLDHRLRVMVVNNAFCRTFRLQAADVIGVELLRAGAGEWDLVDLRRLLAGALEEDAAFEGFEVVAEFRNVGKKRLLLNGRRLRQSADEPDLVLLAMEETAPPAAPRGAR